MTITFYSLTTRSSAGGGSLLDVHESALKCSVYSIAGSLHCACSIIFGDSTALRKPVLVLLFGSAFRLSQTGSVVLCPSAGVGQCRRREIDVAVGPRDE